MARKKGAEKPPNHERWLVSYADFMTLLFAVFVTLYAMSQVDKQKFSEVAASYRDAFSVTASGQNAKAIIPKKDVITIPKVKISPIPYAQYRTTPTDASRQDGKAPFAGKNDFRAIMEALRKKLDAIGATDTVNMYIGARGLVVSLQSSAFFESGKGTLNTASSRALALIAGSLSPYSNPISCEGHTNDTPVSSPSFPSNWELSATRAASVVHSLVETHNFQPERLSISGYGQYRPIADNNSEEGREQNGRVDIVLLDKGGSVREEAAAGDNSVRQAPPPL